MSESPLPNTSDAWLLLALAFGRGEAEGTISSADYLNHAIPNPAEWEHAAKVLGCRGLLAPGDPLPVVTVAGMAIVMEHGGYPIGKFDSVLDQIRGTPVVGGPVPPPSLEALARGYETYSAKAKAVSEQYLQEHDDELMDMKRRRSRTFFDRIRDMFSR